MNKALVIREGSNLEFRANFYNVLNPTSLGAPQNSLSASNFGEITDTVSTERQIELTLKLTF